MRHRIVRSIAGVGFAIIACFATSLAQGNQGTIEGVVSDQSGARISGARFTVTDTSSGAQYVTESNQEGIYRFLLLPVGSYDLEILKQGFTVVRQNRIQITVGAEINLDFTLRVAATPENANVTDEIPIIETTRTPISFTVNKTSVANLPTNGRNFMDFVLLVPGVTSEFLPRLPVVQAQVGLRTNSARMRYRNFR